MREPKKVDGLPDAERTMWLGLWADVAGLLKAARTHYSESRREGILTEKERSQTYAWKMSAGRTYVIDMGSVMFDTFLRVQDTTGKLLTENDDFCPESTNSRLIFTPQAAAIYRIVATSYEAGGTGTYNLRMRLQTNPVSHSSELMQSRAAILPQRRPLMIAPLQIRVHSKQRLVFEAELDRPVEFGRQSRAAEAAYAHSWQKDRWRVVIATKDESYVSRNHIFMEPQPGAKVRLSNTSERIAVVLENGPELRPGESLEAALPIVMVLGDKVVRIEAPRQTTTLCPFRN